MNEFYIAGDHAPDLGKAVDNVFTPVLIGPFPSQKLAEVYLDEKIGGWGGEDIYSAKVVTARAPLMPEVPDSLRFGWSETGYIRHFVNATLGSLRWSSCGVRLTVSAEYVGGGGRWCMKCAHNAPEKARLAREWDEWRNLLALPGAVVSA